MVDIESVMADISGIKDSSERIAHLNSGPS